MPSTCPKCHAVLETDEICCAQVRYTWRCKDCRKLSTGIAVPYGKCFLCGGELEVLDSREIGDPMRLGAMRDAVQFELNSFHFYKMACDRVSDPDLRQVLYRLYEAELDHLHELEEKYHAHLDREIVDTSPGWLTQDLAITDQTTLRELYELALAMEKRTRDHFQKLAASLPEGLEREMCQELAAEEEEHVAMLETEMEQL
jgi:rubrerythrin